ncbi:hypothetical protein EVAR_32718_1 [Eumeta japonica]|uniref:Uncharacterized protein n=1 Tax=Eumeta variegata TaxID=151549 RepID=A0A4C1ZCZ7_EUMVA|nr:hypothetical protein EVAR_32718_1 [Eumeta japonica]
MCRRSSNQDLIHSETELDSFSDESNESNDEGFTQVQSRKARKPKFYATYGPGFIRLSGKKPKASSSSIAPPSQWPSPPLRPSSYLCSKRLTTRLSGVLSGSQIPRIIETLSMIRLPHFAHTPYKKSECGLTRR